MSRNPLRFFLFDKVKKVRPEVSGESLLWLRRVKSIFILFSIIVGARIRSPRTTLTFVPPQVINIFSRLSVNPLLSKMDCVSIPREEWMSLESLLCSLAETQSFSIWMLGVLLHHINDCSFVPSDINISERLCGSITSFNIRNHAFIVKAQAYLAQQRRSLQLFHLPPSVSAEQKACLLSTSPFEKDLFDPSVLPLSLSTKRTLLLLLILTLLSLSSALPSLSLSFGKKKRKAGQISSSFDQDMAGVGSPLTGSPCSVSASTHSFAGNKFSKRGRVCESIGRGSGNPPRGDGKTFANSHRIFRSRSHTLVLLQLLELVSQPIGDLGS